MTFSERMIAKYGQKRWEEMQAEQKAYENREMVTITGLDKLNHSVANYVMTGDSLSKDAIAKPAVKHVSRVVSSRPMTATEKAFGCSKPNLVEMPRTSFGKTISLS